jgi:hypothetical protein
MMNNTNVYIAAITTAWARMKLYEHLKACLSDDRQTSHALYCDTDSVIYKSRVDFKLPIGLHLGQLTNELASNDHISLFVSGGPKNYAFRTKNGEECVKVKGFSLHASNRQVFTVDNLFDLTQTFVQNDATVDLFRVPCQPTRIHQRTMKRKRSDLLQMHELEDDEGNISTHKKRTIFDVDVGISVWEPYKIHRTNVWRVYSGAEQRVHSFFFDKRMVERESFNTFPFGF